MMLLPDEVRTAPGWLIDPSLIRSIALLTGMKCKRRSQAIDFVMSLCVNAMCWGRNHEFQGVFNGRGGQGW